MKYLLTSSMLCVVLNFNAQIRNYYLETTVLKPQIPKSYSLTEKVEFTGVSLTPIRLHFRSILQERLKYERNGFQLNKLNDSVVLYKERYISKNDPEINPKSDFLDVEYKLHLATHDSIIESVNITGSENMVGEVFKKYWNTEVNLLENADDPIVASCTNQNDSIQLIQSVKSNTETARNYAILIIDKNNNIGSVLWERKKLVAVSNAEKKSFFDARRRKTFQIKNESEVKYTAYKATISSVLVEVLHNESSLTGYVSVVLKKDPLGRTWVDVFGKNARVNSALRDNLSVLKYENITDKGFYMTTIDTFYFDYSSVHEEVDMRKNTVGIHVRSTNFPVVEEVARAEANRTPIAKADLKYNVSYVEVNGTKNPRVVNTSTVEKMTGGQVVLGVLGGIFSLILYVVAEDEE